jgi:hypothetical protein
MCTRFRVALLRLQLQNDLKTIKTKEIAAQKEPSEENEALACLEQMQKKLSQLFSVRWPLYGKVQ